MKRPYKEPRRFEFAYLVGYDAEKNICDWETVWAGDECEACLLMGGRMPVLYGINAIVRKDRLYEFYDELAEVLA